MIKEEQLLEVRSYLARVSTNVKLSNSIGHYDLNKICEDIFTPILASIYNLPDLANLNSTHENYPAVDLGCRSSRVAIQVTSTSTSTKAINTLEKFKANNLDKEFDKLIIFIITEKQKTYTSEKLLALAKTLNFEPKTDILDTQDIFKALSEKNDPALLTKILDILKSEFERNDKFHNIRENLDVLFEKSQCAIKHEITSRKYIPNVYSEPFIIKDKARTFINPTFFIRKIIFELSKIDTFILNSILSKMSQPSFSTSDTEDFFSQILELTYHKLLDRTDDIKDHIKLKLEVLEQYNFLANDIPLGMFKIKSSETMAKLSKLSLWHEIDNIKKVFNNIGTQIDLVNSRVFLITSLAGQGKTNFLCDLTLNCLNKFEIPNIYISARELNRYREQRVISYILNNRHLNELRDKFELFKLLESISCERNTPFIIIIDGINEVKDTDGFSDELFDLIELSKQYYGVRFIITCRDEFFNKKFSKFNNEAFSSITFKVDNLKSKFTNEQLKRALESYFYHFNVIGSLSRISEEFILNDFLLMRIFFETNEGCNIGEKSEVYKIDVFEKYIIETVTKKFTGRLKALFLPTIYKLAESMLESRDFNNIKLLDFDTEQSTIIEMLIDEDIILRRELPSEDIFALGSEQVNFTYDELRDFLISLYLVNKIVVEKETIDWIDLISDTPCYEGVIKFMYLLSKAKDYKDIIDLIEKQQNFNDHYTTIVTELKDSMITDSDIERVKSILGSTENKLNCRKMSSVLFRRTDESRKLNINILLEHMKSLDKDDLCKYVANLFISNYSRFRGCYPEVEEYVKEKTPKLNSDNIYFLHFFLLVSCTTSFSNFEAISNKIGEFKCECIIQICKNLSEAQSIDAHYLSQFILKENQGVLQ